MKGLPGWEEHRYEGYKPIAVDTTGFWRPELKGCLSKHYHPAAQRALPAVIMGMVGEVGEIGGQRLAIPQAIERVNPKEPSEKRLYMDMFKKLARYQKEDEIIVVDAGVKIGELQEAGIKNYEGRQAKNFTARRNYLPEYKGVGCRPKYGALIRPLERTRKDKTIEASEPDAVFSYQEDGKTIQIAAWYDLVLPNTKPSQDNKTFDVYVIVDPDHIKPWVLATSVKLQPPSVRSIYHDR